MVSPTVFLAVHAKQKEPVLEMWLENIRRLDYPKDRIILYVRANNSTDATVPMIRDWVGRHGGEYLRVIEDYSEIDIGIERMAVHDWSEHRLHIIGKIRERSCAEAVAAGADFYYVQDIDNFVLPHTLSKLVSRNLPIVAPILYNSAPTLYSNYHSDVDDRGYHLDSVGYVEIHSRRVKGLIDVPVVHCTYLMRADVLPQVKYTDGSGRFEYVIHSENCRRLGIPQYLDNTEPYGCLTMCEDAAAVMAWMAGLGYC